MLNPLYRFKQMDAQRREARNRDIYDYKIGINGGPHTYRQTSIKFKMSVNQVFLIVKKCAMNRWLG